MDDTVPGLTDRRETDNFLDPDPTIIPYEYFRIRRLADEAARQTQNTETSQNPEAFPRWHHNCRSALRGAEPGTQQGQEPASESEDIKTRSRLDVPEGRPDTGQDKISPIGWLIIIAFYTLFLIQLKGLLF